MSTRFRDASPALPMVAVTFGMLNKMGRSAVNRPFPRPSVCMPTHSCRNVIGAFLGHFSYRGADRPSEFESEDDRRGHAID